MVISCGPVAVQLGIQLEILTVHLNSFCIEVYRVTNFFSCEFIVAFFLIYLCYGWKSKTDLIRNFFWAENGYSVEFVE